MKKSFVRDFQNAIDRHRQIAVQSIAKLLGSKIPDDLEILQIETDCQGWGKEAATVYALDRYSQEVSRRSPFGGRPLFTADPFLPEDILEADLIKKTIDPAAIGTRLLGDWLGARWREAGGARWPRRAYFQHHDSRRYLDLKSGRWKTY